LRLDGSDVVLDRILPAGFTVSELGALDAAPLHDRMQVMGATSRQQLVRC